MFKGTITGYFEALSQNSHEDNYDSREIPPDSRCPYRGFEPDVVGLESAFSV
jgi:hypothetical protein